MATADTASASRRAPSVPVQPTQAGHVPAGSARERPGRGRAAEGAGRPRQGQPATLIGSVQRAMRLLETVAAHEQGAPAKQLARQAGLALPTTYHLLRTLVHEGYLRRDSGLFHLGDAAERLSRRLARQKRRGAVTEALAHWHDAVGAPLYCARYRDGEIEVVGVADSEESPAVDEWADFRATGHAHAIGQCLLSQLDEDARRDHLARYPVQRLTPYTVEDERVLLRRLAACRHGEPVIEHQEYVLGTVCAAIPIRIGTLVATVAVSLPAQQADGLLPAARRLQAEIGRQPGVLALSFSI
ncbi:IclR family transcriptional regulator [Streptomyces sp. NPDC056600]|uniref:IclR family transcriptional regulator n=1 Tax=Streptomyces sp. NPDC056600 TaxID=3345874 RepID=UPI0036D0D633